VQTQENEASLCSSKEQFKNNQQPSTWVFLLGRTATWLLEAISHFSSVLLLSCIDSCLCVMYACKIFPWKISCRNHTLLSAVFCDKKSPSSKNRPDQNLQHFETVWKLSIFTLQIIW